MHILPLAVRYYSLKHLYNVVYSWEIILTYLENFQYYIKLECLKTLTVFNQVDMNYFSILYFIYLSGYCSSLHVGQYCAFTQIVINASKYKTDYWVEHVSNSAPLIDKCIRTASCIMSLLCNIENTIFAGW